MKNRLSVKEIAERLDIGRVAVYAMLDSGTLPSVRVGKRWIVTHHKGPLPEPLPRLGYLRL
jgi:excisionase family DNA binding protein